MKKTLNIIGNVFSWVFNIAMVLLLVVACFTVFQSYQTGEPANIFGYKPVYILTGSMEPTMKTNSLAITKNLSDEDKASLEKGDIVTYHVYDEGYINENGENVTKKIVITHRIYNIKINEETGEKIYRTKGDGNNVGDSYTLTDDNIDAKVVYTWNGFADIVAKWNSGLSGKLLILSPVGIILLLYIAFKSFFGGDDDNQDNEPKKNKKNKKEAEAPVEEISKSEFKMPTFFDEE